MNEFESSTELKIESQRLWRHPCINLKMKPRAKGKAVIKRMKAIRCRNGMPRDVGGKPGKASCQK
jgi:hypothetical protein